MDADWHNKKIFFEKSGQLQKKYWKAYQDLQHHFLYTIKI